MFLKGDRGQSTVEFALVLPLVLLVLLALLQAGLLLKDRLLIESAAREGAREAAVTADRSKVVGAARRAAPGLELNVVMARGRRRGDPVEVTVEANPTRLPLVGTIVANVHLHAKAVMRVENQ